MATLVVFKPLAAASETVPNVKVCGAYEKASARPQWAARRWAMMTPFLHNPNNLRADFIVIRTCD